MASWSWAVAVDPLVLLAILATVFGGTVLALKSLRRLLRKVEEFLEDWRGSEARPGVAARPGVMERLSVSELHIIDISSRVNEVVDRLNNS